MQTYFDITKSSQTNKNFDIKHTFCNDIIDGEKA